MNFNTRIYYYVVMKIISMHLRGKKRSTDMPQYLAFMFCRTVPILAKIVVASLCQHHSIQILWVRFHGVSTCGAELITYQIKYILVQAKDNVILIWNITLMISYFQFNNQVRWYICMTTDFLLYYILFNKLTGFWILNSLLYFLKCLCFFSQ